MAWVVAHHCLPAGKTSPAAAKAAVGPRVATDPANSRAAQGEGFAGTGGI